MERRHARAAGRAFLAVALSMALVPISAFPALAAPVIDGNASEWGGGTYSSDGASWSIEQDEDNYYVFIGKDYYVGGDFSFGGTTITVTDDGGSIKGPGWSNVDGSSVAFGTDGNLHYCEFSIPKSYFDSPVSSVSFGGTTVDAADIPGPSSSDNTGGNSGDSGNTGSGDSGNTGSGSSDSGNTGTGSASQGSGGSESSGSNTGATGSYNGIVIDGSFSDWDSVPKTDVVDYDINGNPKGWDTVNQTAVVWDGDYVYLYFQTNSDSWTAPTGGGTHNNGQYAITTDLGNQLLVQLGANGTTPTVSGIEGATVAVSDTNWGGPHQWEVAIPASALPAYNESINFGFYKGETLVENVTDRQGSDKPHGEFNGVVIDGYYDDWTYYPHETVEYATSGTDGHAVDSRAALYMNDGKVYGHVSTTIPAHLQEAGGEFTSAVTLKVNDSSDLEFRVRYIAVDENGNINWNPQLSGLPDGTYEYRMVSLDAPGTSTNINDLAPGDEIYGTAYITVGPSKDEMEYEIDADMLASHLRPNGEGTDITHLNGSDIKTVSVQYGRLGQQWVSTAGTSTGPWLGIGLSVAVVAAVLGVQAARRKKKADALATEVNQAGMTK